MILYIAYVHTGYEIVGAGPGPPLKKWDHDKRLVCQLHALINKALLAT